MSKIASQPLRTPRGQMTWEAFVPWFRDFIKDQLRFSDIQDDNQKPLAGRTVALTTLTTNISNAGRAASQRFLHPVNASNINSIQSTTTPISSTSDAGAATITVAAHSIKMDFGTVSYNAGTITGLALSTLYYVYADDANFAGGAVTYLATTNSDDLISQGRYYVGKITTPAASSTSDGTAGAAGGWARL